MHLVSLSPCLNTVEPYVTLTSWYPTRPHGITTQKAFTAMATWKRLAITVCLHSVALMGWDCPGNVSLATVPAEVETSLHLVQMGSGFRTLIAK